MQKKPKLVPQSVCDLSGRQLTRETCERALGGFDGEPRIDLSRNQLRITPHNFSVNLIALNLAFNCIEDIRGLKVLTQLQSLDLSYNRLYQVDVLLHCTSLVDLQLQGNRLSTSKGIESLKQLKSLNMSDNLIETPDSIRGLSLNVSLHSLSLEGNPISLIKEYRVLVLDLLPTVALLDNKRQSCQLRNGSISKERISYAHIYNAKKQLRCLPVSQSTKQLSNPSAMAKSSSLVHFEDEEDDTEPKAPPHYIAPNIPPKSYAELKAEAKIKQTTLKQKLQEKKSQPASNSTYVSLFDRLAVANGVNIREESTRPRTPLISKSKGRVSSKTIQATKRKIVISPPKDKVHPLVVPTVHPRRHLHFHEHPTKPTGEGAEPTTLNPSQMKVLDVIQGLIQHKRQTIAALNSSLA